MPATTRPTAARLTIPAFTLALLLWPAARAVAYDIVQVTDDSYLSYMPSMLEPPDGSLAIAYERLDANFANGDIMITFSEDGTVWSSPTPVVSGPGNERHPAIVRLNDGTLQVYYLSDETGGYRIHMADSGGGASWTPRGSVDLGWDDEDLVNPTVLSEPDGSLTMSYDVLSDGGYVAHSADGASWDKDRTRVGSGSLNRIMRHSDGTYVVSYQRKTGIWYYQIDIFTKTSTDLASWSVENRVTYTQNSHDSFPVELPDGQYALYFATSTGGDPYDLYSRVAPDGISWDSEENWLPYSGWDTEPHPVRLASGIMALAWPRGAEQNTTQVHFALLDPPTGVADVADGPDSDGATEGAVLTLRASPNPCRGSVVLSLREPVATRSEIRIYNVSGRLLRRIEAPSGAHGVTWDGRDSVGHHVPSSVYFAQVDSGHQAGEARFVLLR